MGPIGWAILGLALGIASPFLYLQLQRRRDVSRASDRSPQMKRAQAARPSNPFAAVSIRPCLESPCAAVLKIQDQRFLAVKAPMLPVAGCDQKRCNCRYVRYADRRRPGDRRDSFARFGGLLPNSGHQDRRGPRVDRRKPRTS